VFVSLPQTVDISESISVVPRVRNIVHTNGVVSFETKLFQPNGTFCSTVSALLRHHYYHHHLVIIICLLTNTDTFNSNGRYLDQSNRCPYPGQLWNRAHSTSVIITSLWVPATSQGYQTAHWTLIIDRCFVIRQGVVVWHPIHAYSPLIVQWAS
jgi:hypothetical protein